MLQRYYVDGHVHIGRSLSGKAVKITGANSLTLPNILEEARVRKGIDIVGVIDAVCAPVQADLVKLFADGELTELASGGLRYRDQVTLLCGAEVEVAGPHGGEAHFGVFVPGMQELRQLAAWLTNRQTNPALYSQRLLRGTAVDLQMITSSLSGYFIVNHAFTPHKGLYGNCVSQMEEMLNPALVSAVELGLSADSAMADQLSELESFTFVTNSDAHSLPKIAREYHVAELDEPSFTAYHHALLRKGSGRIVENVGLWPALGKYHRTLCQRCSSALSGTPARCPECGSLQVTTGVYDRLLQVADRKRPVHPPHRPPYLHQVPLEFIPGLGTRKRQLLQEALGTEMTILHSATSEQLTQVVGEQLARQIVAARSGSLSFTAGAGGRYGKLLVTKT